MENEYFPIWLCMYPEDQQYIPIMGYILQWEFNLTHVSECNIFSCETGIPRSRGQKVFS